MTKKYAALLSHWFLEGATFPVNCSPSGAY